jgi:hypothetical protein
MVAIKMTILMITAGLLAAQGAGGALPPDYKGKPFADSEYKGGPQVIPGKLECAYYDLGGEGVAYHDTDAVNHGSGELNQNANHQRPGATPYIWGFRKDEGVDISYTKDFADFNHPNKVDPPKNQLYVGWEEKGEWTNYTVDVKKAGTYKVIALYGNAANTFELSINNKPAAKCKFPEATGGPHNWNKAEVGTITFAEAGLQLLTLFYNQGNNVAYLEFEPADATATASAPAAGTPIKLLNGKDLTGWVVRGDKAKGKWVVGAARLNPADPTKVLADAGGTDLVNTAKSEDIYTDQKFTDCIVTCEVMTPKGSNSGIFLMGEYEVQVCDSSGKTSNFANSDNGGIYATVAPKNPVNKKPGEWQKFEITFQAPRFDAAGKKISNAKFVKVVLNGSVIHENAEAPKPTGSELSAKEVPSGPLMLQGDHGPIAYRNISITPLK